MTDWLITNARLVNEGEIREADLLVKNGRIDRIDATIAAPSNVTVLDAQGRLLMPGMIDDQVHFRDPGLTHKGDLTTESAAAVAGGITSFMDMPNVKPATTTRAALADKYTNAVGRSYGNYAFYFGATNDNLDEIRGLTPELTCGIKVFMGASTGNMLVDAPEALTGIFAEAPVLVITHCEDTPMILANEQRARDQYGEDVPIEQHPVIRSAEVCYKSSKMATDLAREHDTRLHVLHLTTARELELFSAGPVGNKRITVEACVHHLFFSDQDYAEKGTAIKCNPAVKTEADRTALLKAVADDVIDVVATDHAPHTAEEKANSYFTAPAGLPLVQHAVISMLEHVHRGDLSLEKVIQKVCHDPAILYGITDRGYLREGCWADLALVDLDKPYPVTAENVLYKCGWSPFEGYTFKSSIAATFVNGVLIYRDGKIVGLADGQRLVTNTAR